MTAEIRLAGITDIDLDPVAIARLVRDERAGADVIFSGVVRNHDHGRCVECIEYSAHPSAADVMAEVLAEFTDREGVHAIAAQHRVGLVGIGGLALVVAVSASHRKQAFTCADGIVDRVKQVLPVWKKQQFSDGTHEWSKCP